MAARARADRCLPAEIARHFRFGSQEDAHEFLRYTIDAMQKACLNGCTRYAGGQQEVAVLQPRALPCPSWLWPCPGCCGCWGVRACCMVRPPLGGCGGEQLCPEPSVPVWWHRLCVQHRAPSSSRVGCAWGALRARSLVPWAPPQKGCSILVLPTGRAGVGAVLPQCLGTRGGPLGLALVQPHRGGVRSVASSPGWIARPRPRRWFTRSSAATCAPVVSLRLQEHGSLVLREPGTKNLWGK